MKTLISLPTCIRVSTALIVAVSLFGMAPLEEPQGQPLPLPFVSWAGSYSTIDKRELVRVSDEESWKSLWIRHDDDDIEKDSHGEPVVPLIDFSRFMVIGVFGGTCINTRSQTVEFIDEFPDHVRIRFDAMTYQTMEPAREMTLQPGETIEDAVLRSLNEAKAEHDAKENDPHRTTAYGMFVIPRNAKRIVLEENVQNLIGAPPIWKEQVTFAPLPAGD